VPMVYSEENSGGSHIRRQSIENELPFEQVHSVVLDDLFFDPATWFQYKVRF
jgi:hypothetical protein